MIISQGCVSSARAIRLFPFQPRVRFPTVALFGHSLSSTAGPATTLSASSPMRSSPLQWRHASPIHFPSSTTTTTTRNVMSTTIATVSFYTTLFCAALPYSAKHPKSLKAQRLSVNKNWSRVLCSQAASNGERASSENAVTASSGSAASSSSFSEDSVNAVTDTSGSADSAAKESEGEGAGEKKESKPRVQRRRGTGAALIESVDLLSVPGIGPRNMQKLVEKGIGKLSDLKQLYRDRFLRSGSDRMVDYLRNSVGIVHKNHAESITSYIKDTVSEELKEEPPNDGNNNLQKKRLTFCVEGNISVGKTTFLQRIANETLELRDLVEVVPEPISKWQDVGPDHFNVLNAFYAEPQRYAYTFQNYVFVTRVMQEQESSNGVKPLRLMERSVFSDRMVFVRAVHEAKWMNEMELSIYDSWFDPVVSVLPGLVPDGFIYLRASPDTCHKRLNVRKRDEENAVSLEYLQGLHEKHENWLYPAKCSGSGVLSVSQLPPGLSTVLNPTIKDRIMLLQGDNVHARIQKVPALVLDYEPTIDFNRDIEAKREYAQQIADFFNFVKNMKDSTPEKETTQSKKIMLPSTGGLLGPNGNLLRPQINSPEFWKSLSS